MAFAAGLILEDLTYLAAAVFGPGRLAETLFDGFVVVRIGAADYLGSIAVRLRCSATRAQPAASRQADRPSASFLAGLTVTALVLIAVITPFAAPASRTRHALQDSAFHRRLNRSAAAVMAGAAIWPVARRS